MAINFSGEFTTPRGPEEVFDFLSDPNRFGPLLPDFESMSMQDATHFTVKVKVGVGNIRGSAEIKMELTEAVKPLRAQYRGKGNAIGSQITVSSSFELLPLPESTRVIWRGETAVFGKLASMAGGMLEPLGKKNIQKLIEGLQKALAEPMTQAPVQAPTPETAGAAPETPDVVLDCVGVSQGRTLTTEDSLTSPETMVEAPGVSPASTETQPRGASAPAQNDLIEGSHGNDDAPPNN